MDIRKIRKLIELINETGVGEIEVKSGDDSVRISRAGTAQPIMTHTVAAPTLAAMPSPTHTEQHAAATEHKKSMPNGHEVKSPMVGTVYLSATPGSKPFVEIGQRVQVGDTLCLIEAMKMFNKIEADKAGVISARLTENEQPVEYEQPLFIIDTNE